MAEDRKVKDAPVAGGTKKAGVLNRFDNPWLNWKFLTGAGILGFLFFLIFLGYQLWDTNMALSARAPLNLPPLGFTNWRDQEGVPEHPLGTENSGRDMLALWIVGTPRTIFVGVVAATVGMLAGILLGFMAGFLGGVFDDVIRLAVDITITIPSLLVLIVIQAVLGRGGPADDGAADLAVLVGDADALHPPPRCSACARADTCRWRGSPACPCAISCSRRSCPISCLISGRVISAICRALLSPRSAWRCWASVPQRIPSLGVAIFFSIEAGALFRNMWWWWGIPTVTLSVVFVALLLINLGLDEIANPRLRKAS